MAGRPQQMHGTRIRDGLDKAFLVIAFAVGAAGIVGLKQLDIEPWWAAVFATGVLISYAVAAWLNRNLALEPEVIGDNCYYLGFIFTLISLGVTLYQLAGTGTDASLLRDVVAGFGVALASTIVGVFLRVFMMQLRTDIVSRDRQARLEINDAGREFRMRLAESVAQMKAFSTEAVQLAGETNLRIHEANEAFHVEHRRLIRETTGQYSAALSDLMAASSAIITRDLKASIDATLDEMRREILATFEVIRQAANETGRLQAAEAEAQAERIAQAAAEAQRSHDTLQAWSALLQTVTKDATQTSEAVRGAAQAMGDSVQTSVAQVEAAAAGFEDTLALHRPPPAMDRTATALATAAARLDALSQQLDRQFAERAAPVSVATAVDFAALGAPPSSGAGGRGFGPVEVHPAPAALADPGRR